MTFEQWLATPGCEDIRLQVVLSRPGEERVTGADAVLHVPLIAFALLVIGQYLRNHLRTAEVSSWAAGVLSEKAFGSGGTFKRYEWSFALRQRCSDALVFLETAGFIRIAGESERTIAVTEHGAEFLKFVRSKFGGARLYDDLSRACSAAEARGLTLL